MPPIPVKCTACGQKYHANDVQILSRHQNIYFIQVSCSACHARYLITAALKYGADPEIVTDLTENELPESNPYSAPEANDVLDMHSYLKHFNGDFASLFSGKKV